MPERTISREDFEAIVRVEDAEMRASNMQRDLQTCKRIMADQQSIIAALRGALQHTLQSLPATTSMPHSREEDGNNCADLCPACELDAARLHAARALKAAE